MSADILPSPLLVALVTTAINDDPDPALDILRGLSHAETMALLIDAISFLAAGAAGQPDVWERIALRVANGEGAT